MITQRVITNPPQAAEAKDIANLFAQQQQQENAEIKSIATYLALTEMKLNRWDASESEWEIIYKGVWLEKQLFVKMTYEVSEILDISKQLLTGQQKFITYLGIIISNQGQILKNQEVIITNQGLILDVTGQILDITKDIQATNYEILGTVKDIQGSVNDIKANGVTVKADFYSPGVAKLSKYIGVVAGVLGVILLLVIVLRVVKKKK